MRKAKSNVKVIQRQDWPSDEALMVAIRAELDKKPGLDCLDLCERLGADLRDIGRCLDRLVKEGKVGHTKK